MDGHAKTMTAKGGDKADLCRAQVAIDVADPIGEIQSGLGPGPFELVLLFINNQADFPALARQASAQLPANHVVACTTAGEIGETGYEEGQIVALAFGASQFRACCYPIDLSHWDNPQSETDRLIRTRVALEENAPDFGSEFAFVVVDGLSLREDELTGALAPGLGSMQLFGGSAGDGTEFRHTYIALDGEVMENAAIVSVVRSACPIKVFSLNHLSPTDVKMVVTDADPRHRIVREINAEPAAREYARIVGKMPEQLDQFTFAAHPVVVQVGARHHVRAIQRVNEAGELVFFSAIDDGMVLTLAESEDMASHLERELSRLSEDQEPQAILGCDCILRRLEAGQRQQLHKVSEVLRAHNVRGFSTYGEQSGGLHVNHTMTGVAIYPPSPDDPEQTDHPDDTD